MGRSNTYYIRKAPQAILGENLLRTYYTQLLGYGEPYRFLQGPQSVYDAAGLSSSIFLLH